MKMKYFGATETKLFHFHRIFDGGGGGEERGAKRTPSGSATDMRSVTNNHEMFIGFNFICIEKVSTNHANVPTRLNAIQTNYLQQIALHRFGTSFLGYSNL